MDLELSLVVSGLVLAQESKLLSPRLWYAKYMASKVGTEEKGEHGQTHSGFYTQSRK